MKKETLEEAAENNYPKGDVWTEEQAIIRRLAFKNGAKWQAERMYTYEEVLTILESFNNGLSREYQFSDKVILSHLEQFKKK